MALFSAFLASFSMLPTTLFCIRRLGCYQLRQTKKAQTAYNLLPISGSELVQVRQQNQAKRVLVRALDWERGRENGSFSDAEVLKPLGFRERVALQRLVTIQRPAGSIK